MASPKLDTRTARTKLKVQREPYWVKIDRGLQVGYRRGATGGTWVARQWDKSSEKYQYWRLGLADGFTVPSSHHSDARSDGCQYESDRDRSDGESRSLVPPHQFPQAVEHARTRGLDRLET